MNQRKSTINSSRKRAVAARVAVTIRLPEDVVDKIDSDLERRAVPMSRNNWLLEAAIEKLQRRPAGDSHDAQ